MHFSTILIIQDFSVRVQYSDAENEKKGIRLSRVMVREGRIPEFL